MSNFEKTDEVLKQNYYVGRGILAGQTKNSHDIFLAYMLTGRSENSKNRQLIKRDGKLITKVFDETKVEDPSLIIYTALCEYQNSLILTNGDQTDTIYENIKSGMPFELSLDEREFEPDPPIFTPRISMLVDFDKKTYKMSILKSGDDVGSICDRHFFSYRFLAGRGHFIHTYDTTSDRLRIYSSLPHSVEIPDDFEEFSQAIWDNLNAQNKIALYTRKISLKDKKIEEKLYNIH